MRDIEITRADLKPRVRDLLDQKARFVTATCLDLGEAFEVIYHFDDANYQLVNLRIKVGKDEEVPSISGITLAAALIENEMREFFGIKIVDIAIDFKNRMLLSEESPATPLLKQGSGCEKREEKKCHA